MIPHACDTRIVLHRAWAYKHRYRIFHVRKEECAAAVNRHYDRYVSYQIEQYINHSSIHTTAVRAGVNIVETAIFCVRRTLMEFVITAVQASIIME